MMMEAEYCFITFVALARLHIVINPQNQSMNLYYFKYLRPHIHVNNRPINRAGCFSGKALDSYSRDAHFESRTSLNNQQK
jgi:hypothetical protein